MVLVRVFRTIMTASRRPATNRRLMAVGSRDELILRYIPA
jgi:hypothetical protein